MLRFSLLDTPLAGLKVIQRSFISDDRGSLTRVFCRDELSRLGWSGPISQANYTSTNRRGTIRGLHFQNPPHAETKLVSCLRGEIWDVAVDLRAHSPSFLHWHAEKLSSKNSLSYLIPKGFAHGFQALSDECEVLYFHSDAYNKEAESGICPTDPLLDIQWPIYKKIISQKDQNYPLLTNLFHGIVI